MILQLTKAIADELRYRWFYEVRVHLMELGIVAPRNREIRERYWQPWHHRR